MNEFLTTAQVAERLGMTPDGVRQLYKTGKLASVTTARDRLVDSEILESFMASQAQVDNTHKPGGPGKPRYHRRGVPVLRARAWYAVDFVRQIIYAQAFDTRGACEAAQPTLKAMHGAILRRKSFKSFVRRLPNALQE